MAKKASTIRIFELAKDLGVTSKDLIAKCEAEGIPSIKNHMSTVSLGLAATVREWFGEPRSSAATAVETAAPVDVARVRAKAKKKVTSKAKAAGQTPAAAQAPAQEAVVEPTPPSSPTPPSLSPASPLPTAPVVPGPSEPDTTPVAAPQLPVSAAAAAPETAAAPPGPPAMNVPSRPEVIKPAGPMLQQPTRTTLTGPKVIRVESPEVIPPVATIGQRPDSSIRRGGPRAGKGAGITFTQPTDVPSEPVRTGRTSRRNKRRTAAARDDAGRVGRATVVEARPFNWRTQDLREREARLNRSGGFFKAHRRDSLKRAAGGERAVTAAEVGGTVRIEEPITIKGLSAVTGIRAPEILKRLFLAGNPATLNSTVSSDIASEVMLEFNIELEVIQLKTSEQQIVERFKERKVRDERPRSPVVTILGHVDHGKTSLLDRIRNTNVAGGEAGGITQTTSAFETSVKAGDKTRTITFIDTPGHEAFTEMRARGANVTDIVVLVVAADDGVMPQTIESISHANAAGVPIVVALNKVDKPEATEDNIQRILGQLAEHNLNPSEWGGSTEVVRTSALKGEGTQDLLDVLDYQAELVGLKADFAGDAQGTVLEARMEEGRGSVANLLVEQGCLKKGDFVVVGRAFGRIRDIVNDRGERVNEAGPSMPVAISGISNVPDAGDKFYIAPSLKDAEAAARERIDQDRRRELAREKISLDNIFEQFEKGTATELPLVIKADVQGLVDALTAVLEKLSTDDVKIAIKHAAVGGINESDIVLADAAAAIIIGFNVTTSVAARAEANSLGIDIRLYDVIYDLTDDVVKAMEGLLEPEHKLEVLGHSEVREVFKISKVGMVAGCYVTDGLIERNAQIRVTRDGIVIEKDRRLQQLKRFKEDVKEARNGQECGMKIEGYDDIKVGDVLECYKTLEVRRVL
ncbi:MAG: translation initiation factor IF-2 [Planctomycetes bacterium]|nr:translation initiation factor IF-2 [Planctomycetota bacterium]